MGIEIERKFLVKEDFDPKEFEGYSIKQGYFLGDENKVTRVRTYGEKGYLTLKAKLNQQFKVRQEFEYEIPLEDALELLQLCNHPIIEKTRYRISHFENLWEVDVFEGLNQGLVIAEIELKNETEEVELPYWVDKEVTEDKRYINSYLAVYPFQHW